MDINHRKEEFAKFWTNAIVFEEKIPANFGLFSYRQIIEWCFKNLIICSGKILLKWGIEPDQEIIKKINEEKDLQGKAFLEKLYIFNFQQKITQFIMNQERKNSKWNSWPTSIMENSSFNCTGGTTLSIWMLSKLKLKSYIGIIPFSHVFNIVELSNKELFCLDLVNMRVYSMLDIETIDVEGHQCLDLSKKPGHPSSIIPIFDTHCITYMILNNASIARSIGMGEKESYAGLSGLDVYGALSFYSEKRDFFPSYPIFEARDEFFPEIKILREKEVFKEEMKKVNGFIF
uniref:Uncharacterized protein n=1 Tax=candidate division CPR3 bacterium TaxID=2268181 RepID=A0A7C4QX79_UNCC3